MAQPACASPTSYYAGVDASSLGGAGLKSALHNLIRAHTVVSYADAWEALAILDASPSDATKVVGIYSTHEHGAVADRGITTGWNREHSWPKSYGVGYSGPDYSDLHALFAADWNVNSARNNLFFDDCNGAGCSTPAHAEAAPTTAKDSSRFMPPANKRGDIARAMFYMAVRYDGSEANTADLELAEVPDASASRMGVLSTLLAWHAADPIDAAEAARNNRICSSYQENRNPFIDRQEWATCIFVVGGTCADAPPFPPVPPPLPPSPPPLPSSPPMSCLLLTGIIDGPLSGGTPKAAELYTTCDVSDLSAYGLGKATNGGGVGATPSFTFVVGTAAAAGTFLYVSYEASNFAAFFGFAPTASGVGALNVNGDDAVALYHDNAIIDVFGETSVDGTGTAWEYTDGWAYRVARTTAFGGWATSHWSFSGKNALDTGCSPVAAASCSTPFPRATYVPPYSPPSPPPSPGLPLPPHAPPLLPPPLLPPPPLRATAPLSPLGALVDAPPAAPGGGYLPTVGVVFTLSGSVSAFEAAAFEARLRARFPACVGVGLNVSAGSVVVDCTLIFADGTSALSAASAVQATSAATMQSAWFGGSVTVETVSKPRVLVSQVDDAAMKLAVSGGGKGSGFPAVAAVAVGVSSGVLALGLLSLLIAIWTHRASRQRISRQVRTISTTIKAQLFTAHV